MGVYGVGIVKFWEIKGDLERLFILFDNELIT
jgi:hypothetical protein